MLILFETAAGYTLWRVTNEGILEKDDLCASFPTAKDAEKVLKYVAYRPFTKTSESVKAIQKLSDNNIDESLQQFLKENIIDKKLNEKLQVSNAKLASVIKENLGIHTIGSNDEKIPEIFRLIRSQLTELIPGVSTETFRQLELGVSHELSAQTFKFSPSKLDSMIVHSVGFLEELDKELNNYGMRVREWYGWHFPELKNVTQDNFLFAKIVLAIGRREDIDKADFTDTNLDVQKIEEIKKLAASSIGTELTDEDIECIKSLCTQVIELTGSRNRLSDYIRVRMQAIAPNLTEIVGETVGSRLIAHAGSLQKLARCASSTVQVCGAEKALFKALKEGNKSTPKYGYLYHAHLVSHSDNKIKGQIARTLAAKAALSSRFDSFCDEPHLEIATSDKEYLENYIKNKSGQKVKFNANRAKVESLKSKSRAERAVDKMNVFSVEETPAYKEQDDFHIQAEELPKKKRRRHRSPEEKAAEEK